MDELSSIKSSQSYKRVIFQEYIILNIVFSSNLCKRVFFILQLDFENKNNECSYKPAFIFHRIV